MHWGETLVAVSGILALFVICPAVILHYMLQFRKTRGLSSEDERLLQHLFESAQKLEGRIANLEKILEASKGTER